MDNLQPCCGIEFESVTADVKRSWQAKDAAASRADSKRQTEGQERGQYDGKRVRRKRKRQAV